MLFLRIYWNSDEEETNRGDFLLLTEEEEYEYVTEEEAKEIFETSLEVVNQLGPLLKKIGIKYYISQN